MTEFTELRIYADGDWRVVGAEHDIVTELHTAAGAEAWDVLGASEADTLAWLAATANPGAAAALLRTDDDGKVTLEGLAVGRVGSSLIPALTDTYDVGSSLLWWREGYISQLNAVLFAEEQISLMGGWLMVPPDAGNLAGDVAATDTQVDFGKAMTPGHLILIWAKDAGGSAKKEYMEVGALVSGTTYNVTRDLAAAHGTDPAWSAGTPFCVLGTNGSGRIEINAYDTPRISVVRQGAAYNAQTELVRLGDLDGEWGYSTETYGLAVGDYASGNYLLADDDHLKLAFGGEGVVLDEDGLTFFAADQIWMPGYLKFKDALGEEVCRLLSVHYVGGVETQLFTHVIGEDVAEMSLVTMCSYGPDPATATARTVIAASTEGWGASLYVEAFGYDKGRVRTGSGGLLVGGGDDDWPPWGNIWVGIDARIGGGLYVGGLGVDPGPGTITATGTITGNIVKSDDYMVAVGGLRVGSSSDPGANNLSVAGVATIGDYLVAVGGLRVGSSSDPGANNLSVAGAASVGGTITATGDITAARHIAKDPTNWGFLVDMVGTGGWANRGYGFRHGETYLGGFDAFGSSTSITYFYVGTSYNDSGAVRFYPATGDVRTAGGLYVGSLAGDPAAGWGYFVNGLYVGDTANANQTKGLTINQGSATDEILALKNSGVAHGMTSVTETDTFAYITPAAAAGGLSLVGLRATGNSIATAISGWLGETASTTKSNSGYGVVHIAAGIKSGTGVGSVGADGNLLSIASYTTTRFIFDADGDAFSDVQWLTFDTHDDLALLEQLEVSFQPVRAEFGDWLEENRQALLDAGIVGSYNDTEGRAMVNWTRLAMLHTGAIRQLGARLATYERELLRLGADPALLN